MVSPYKAVFLTKQYFSTTMRTGLEYSPRRSHSLTILRERGWSILLVVLTLSLSLFCQKGLEHPPRLLSSLSLTILRERGWSILLVVLTFSLSLFWQKGLEHPPRLLLSLSHYTTRTELEYSPRRSHSLSFWQKGLNHLSFSLTHHGYRTSGLQFTIHDD